MHSEIEKTIQRLGYKIWKTGKGIQREWKQGGADKVSCGKALLIGSQKPEDLGRAINMRI